MRRDNFFEVVGPPAASLGLLLLAALVVGSRTLPRSLLGPVLLCVVISDLCVFGWQHRLPIAARDVFDLAPLQPVGGWIQKKQADEYFRVYWPNHLQVDEEGMAYEARAPLAAVWGISSVDGYSQLKPRAYDHLWQTLPLSRTLELLNVKYMLGDAEEGLLPHQRPEFVHQNIAVSRTSSHLPRAFLARRCRSVRSRDALDIMAQPSFNPLDEVLLSEYPSSSLPEPWPDWAQGHVEITHYQPETIVLLASLPCEGVLVLSEPYFPGWTCKVDGERTKIWPADFILRAVVLPPGTHQVTFVYSPMFVRAGVIISLIGLLLSIVILFRAYRWGER